MICATTILSVAVPLVVIVSIWAPVFCHYHVDSAGVSKQVVEASRTLPEDIVLAEIGAIDLGFPENRGTQRAATEIADEILGGRLRLPGEDAHWIRVPFDASDLEAGPIAWQLRLAGLIVPRLLMAGYRERHDDRFLDTALAYVLDFAEFERSAWLPRGFLWNDHAVAARVVALSEIWRWYRHHRPYDSEKARRLVAFAARTAELLAKPSHYTYATNHGLMQSLAMLHLGVAFPEVAAIRAKQKLATERLQRQWGFLVNDEGVILEHSAGYHAFGLELLGYLLRYMTLLDEPIPDEWREKYQKAKEFYAALRRPDCTLPRIGDTRSVLKPGGPKVTSFDQGKRAAKPSGRTDWRPANEQTLVAAAGYLIWWDGLEHWPASHRLRQTVVNWSYYPGHGHKHADELSIMLWADGLRWWTSVGYWPYSLAGREEAVSWGSSNAPHLIGEARASMRTTSLRAVGWSEELAAVELERRLPDGLAIRRQIVFVKPDLWLVADSFDDREERRVRTIWTTDDKIGLAPGAAPGTYLLRGVAGNQVMSAYLLGETLTPGAGRVERLEPTGGAVESNGVVVRTARLVVEQPSKRSWSMLVSQLGGHEGGSPRAARVASWVDAERWAVEIPSRDGTITVDRRGSRVALSTSDQPGREKVLLLDAGTDVAGTIAKTQAAFAMATEIDGQKFHPLLWYRSRMSAVLLGVFIVQQTAVLALRRRWPRLTGSLAVTSVVAWAALGVWLSEVYFAA